MRLRKLTQLKARFEHAPAAPCEQLVFRFRKEDYFARFQGVPFTTSMQSVVLATYAAYAYATKSLPRSENFSVGALDVRRICSFFEGESPAKLDLTRTLGATTLGYTVTVHGNVLTTLRDFLNVLQGDLARFQALTPEERWGRLFQQEYAPIQSAPADHIQLSNIGQCDLGEGPLHQFAGAVSDHSDSL